MDLRRRFAFMAPASAPPDWHLLLIGRSALLLLLIAGWEVYARTFADAVLIAPPSAVVAALGPKIFGDPQVVAAIWATLIALAIAFALSVVVGLACGIAIGITTFGRSALMPAVLLLYAIPQAIMLPLFILGFGIGPASKIAFGFSHGVFPVLITTASAMRGVNPVILRGAVAMGATRMQIIRYIYWPHMWTSLFSAMRLAMTMTLLGVFLAELFVSTAGIGYFTRVFTETFDPAPLFALIAVLAFIAIFLNEGLRIFQRRALRWKSG
jgi:ABC-type nitrate/sulfonate/bicarbonate transport system permease component